VSVSGIDHIQLAMPAGGEDRARRFYGGVLGFEEVAKPAGLAARGGVWFRRGGMNLHLGIDRGFRPAQKAHPGFLSGELDRLADALGQRGNICRDHLGRRRFYADDPFGNRLEFIESG
jgi:catechol 2,3-dioxygenase-like lactoylglutathione lyase family enzyme